MKQNIKREIIYWIINVVILICLVLANTTGILNSLKMWVVIASSMFIGRGLGSWIDGKVKKEDENN